MNYLAQTTNFFSNTWHKIISFFTSYHWKEILLNIKIASIIISLIFAALIVFLVIKINTKGRLQRAVAQDASTGKINDKKIVKKWKKIEKKLLANSQTNYKLAILEADELFDRILQILGPTAEIKIPNFKEIEEIKKTKESILENPQYALTREETEKTIGAYTQALKDLGIM